MSKSLASKIKAANSSLIIDGNIDAIGKFFADDYVVHLTDQVLTGGHDTIKKIIDMYRRAFSDIQKIG